MNCELCSEEEAEDTEFGCLCKMCYDVQLAAHLDLMGWLNQNEEEQ